MLDELPSKALGVLRRWLHWAKRHRILVVLSGVGLVGLYDGLGSVAFVVVGAAIVIDLLARVSRYVYSLGLVLGTITVPWLGLLGFDVLFAQLVLSWLPALRPGLLAGLILGVLVFAAVATRLLVLWQERLGIAIAIGFLLALLNVVVPPLVLGDRKAERKVAPTQPIVSRLDAVIVVPGRTAERVAKADEQAPLPGWRVRYSVARASGRAAAQWLVVDTDDAGAARDAALGTGAAVPDRPRPRDDADQVVLLDVDGTPPVTPRPWELPEVDAAPGEVERWLAIVAGLKVPATTPVVALLQSTSEKRRAAWDEALSRRGGFALSVQQRRARSITEAALHAAIEKPTSDLDLSIAVRFRPLLLFSGNAKASNASPLDVDALLRKGLIQLCHDGLDGSSDCARVESAADLVNGDTHLKVPREGAKLDVPAPIYVHPTRVRAGKRELLYLDYWWYMLSNPNEVGLGGFCGAGLSLPGLTCFEHDSDWEGVTVVVERTGDEVVPVAVQYAQHSDVIRYSFAQLRDNDWSKRRIRTLLHDVGVKSVDTQDRPLVFVASGSHASYPTPCFKDCRQLTQSGVGEDRHDGRSKPTWAGNDANACLADGCVRATPTRGAGNLPALWNAYEGVWGERSCILGSYCTAEVSPSAPGKQKRYQRPARITGYVDAGGRFIACGGDGKAVCPPLPAAGR